MKNYVLLVLWLVVCVAEVAWRVVWMVVRTVLLIGLCCVSMVVLALMLVFDWFCMTNNNEYEEED